MRLSSLAGPLAVILLPYLIFEYIRRQPMLDESFVLPRGHFYIVSSVAMLALLIALAVGVAGSRLRNIQVSFLSLSFISLAEMFMVHGLSTPHFMMGVTHLPSIAAPLSVMIATFWLWLSSLPSDFSLIAFLSRHQKLLLPGWTVGLGIVGAGIMMFPELVNVIKLDAHPFNWSVTALVILLNAVTAYRYYRSYLYSRFPLQLAIVCSAGWLSVAQAIMTAGEIWKVSWWLYHFLLLAAMIVMVAGLLKQHAVNRTWSGAIRALFTSDPMERIANSISPSVKALMLATETKDTYTAGHNYRVTVYAMRIAEELQLRPDQLRALAHGTIVHDIGKLEVPDAILNKPGRLTPEERVIIEQHPIRGYKLCRSLGFMQDELDIIRFHHEKWNGEGYPDRLKGMEIPRMARIVAVADVYDALTSNRSYRQAMSHDEAMAFLKENKGTHFEPVCVEAWERACEADPSIYRCASQEELPQRMLVGLNRA